jgi:hypothetical protein
MEPMSFVKACKMFFEAPPHGRKIEISEFKALTHKDKIEIREGLIAQGYDVNEVIEVVPLTS